MTDLNTAPDSYFKGLGWRAISRDADGRVVSAIMPLSEGCYLEWVIEQADLGYTVVEMQ